MMEDSAAIQDSVEENEPQTDSPIDSAARERLMSISPNDGAGFYMKIARIFLTNLESIVHNLKLGALESDDNRTQLAAHELKSSSHNIGAVRLAEMCNAAEEAARNGEPYAGIVRSIEEEAARVRDYLKADLPPAENDEQRAAR